MQHQPVLLSEVMESMNPHEGGVYFDGTFGGGGYSKAILEKGGNVIALDRDPDVLPRAEELERKHLGRLSFILGKFSGISSLIDKTLDGAVFDFGVSSFQIDTDKRGFSFYRDGPLDMRMSKEGLSASDVINTLQEEDLIKIIDAYGEEPQAKKIAKLIMFHRPFYTTRELALVIEKHIPKHSKIHPATLTFQAFRIYVNNELQEIYQGLEQILPLLKKNGRLLCVTFHGLEDRVVKDFAKAHALKSHPIICPSRHEIRTNPRARSGKLRVYQLKTSESLHALQAF